MGQRERRSPSLSGDGPAGSADSQQPLTQRWFGALELQPQVGRFSRKLRGVRADHKKRSQRPLSLLLNPYPRAVVLMAWERGREQFCPQGTYLETFLVITAGQGRADTSSNGWREAAKHQGSFSTAPGPKRQECQG